MQLKAHFKIPPMWGLERHVKVEQINGMQLKAHLKIPPVGVRKACKS
jgi:hypothetical protein